MTETAASQLVARDGDDAPESDGVLVAAVANGNPGAFRTLMVRHLPKVLGFAQRLAGNRADAEEIAQEAFLRVWTTAPRWRADGGAEFRTWLYRVTLNLCLDRKRRRPVLPLEAAGDPADPAPGSLDRIAADQTARLVANALDCLPARQKAAITLFYYGGLSGAEAAQVLEISPSALESLLVRGRRALRRQLDQLGLMDSTGGTS